jgi:hypothetical protein
MKAEKGLETDLADENRSACLVGRTPMFLRERLARVRGWDAIEEA